MIDQRFPGHPSGGLPTNAIRCGSAATITGILTLFILDQIPI
jgi:hypothetical protein